MNLEHEAERRDGMTFVTATVHNPAPVTRHVRLENRLEGAVLPPRSNGVPERGWDEAGITLTVPAGETIGIGYACSSPPADPAVEIETTGRGPAPEDDLESRARRTLGTFRPPRVAVTKSGTSGVDDANQSQHAGRNQTAVDEPVPESPGAHEGVTEGRGDSTENSDDIDRAIRRIELGERLAAAGVEEAADALEELAETDLVGDGTAPVGPAGIADAKALDTALEDDTETLEGEASRLRSKADRLRRAAKRAEENAAQVESQADRARSVELPLDVLGRFA